METSREQQDTERVATVFVGMLVILMAVAWLGGIEQRGMFFPDEGRYAEIPREMAE